MKAIIKQFFLHGVGQRFFQFDFDKFKIQGKSHKQLNSKQKKLKLKRNRFLKYRKWVFFSQMLRVIRWVRPCHILFLFADFEILMKLVLKASTG